jgi:hypothetical protein
VRRSTAALQLSLRRRRRTRARGRGGPRPHGRSRRDGWAPREMRHGSAAPVSTYAPPPHAVELLRPASFLPQQSRRLQRRIPPSLARVRRQIRWLLLSLLSCGAPSARVEVPNLHTPVMVCLLRCRGEVWIGETRVVTSPLANAELSHSNVQSTKHEHTNPVYLYSPYQTRVVCIDLARFSLAWLQILARLELTRLPNTPYVNM